MALRTLLSIGQETRESKMKQSIIESEAFGRRLNRRAEKAERDWRKSGKSEWIFERVTEGLTCAVFRSVYFQVKRYPTAEDFF